jgi:hypothetical protein
VVLKALPHLLKMMFKLSGPLLVITLFLSAAYNRAFDLKVPTAAGRLRSFTGGAGNNPEHGIKPEELTASPKAARDARHP